MGLWTQGCRFGLNPRTFQARRHGASFPNLNLQVGADATLSEKLLRFGEEGLFGFGVLLSEFVGEGLKFFTLPDVELGGDGDFDGDVEVAMAVFAENFEALATKSEGGAILGAGGDLDAGAAFEGGDAELASEGGLGEGEGHVAVEVVALALKDLVGSDANDDVEIAGGATFDAHVAIALRAEARALLDAGGDLDADAGFFLGAAIAAAGFAGIGDNLATALTFGASLLNLKEAPRGDDLTGTAAGVAGGFTAAAGGAAAFAAAAMDQALVTNLFLSAVGGFFEGELDGVAKITAALGAITTTASAAASTAEEGLEDPSTTAASGTAEDLTEDIEGIVETTPATACPRAAHAGGEGAVPVTIIGGAFFVVAEDVVGLTDFFEAFLGSGVTWVLVRVIFDRELAVGFLQLVAGDVA